MSSFSRMLVVALELLLVLAEPIYARGNSSEEEVRSKTDHSSANRQPNSISEHHNSTSNGIQSTHRQSSNGILKGRVIRKEGDFSPSRKLQGSKTSEAPISTEVYIFKGGTVKGLGPGALKELPEKNKSLKPVKSLKSDAKGNFEVELPPGIYTVLIKAGDQLYKNLYDGQGYYTSIRVESGKTSFEEIQDSRDALGAN